MITIWKFELRDITTNTISMPVRAKILALKEEKDHKAVIWAMVNTEAEKEDRTFEVFNTGEEIKFADTIRRKYIGTFRWEEGDVFHVFELLNKSKETTEKAATNYARANEVEGEYYTNILIRYSAFLAGAEWQK